MKRIYIHPFRIDSLRPKESFEIDSNLGGSFTVRFDQWSGQTAWFTITSSQRPPEGWKGERRTFHRDELVRVLFQCVPENPFMDNGRKELAALRHLGYPEGSTEITTLLRRCPKRAPKAA